MRQKLISITKGKQIPLRKKNKLKLFSEQNGNKEGNRSNPVMRSAIGVPKNLDAHNTGTPSQSE